MYIVILVLRGAMPSSEAAAVAAAADRTEHRQPAASSQHSVVGTSNRLPWVPFWSWGNVSLPPSSDVLRGFFNATLDRGKPARALKET